MTNETKAIKTIEYFDDRWYKIINGESVEYLESVTTVLNAYPKPGLARWRGDVGNREADLRMKEGGDKGTNVHSHCRQLLAGFKIGYVPKNEPMPIVEEGTVVIRSQEEYLAVYRFWQWMKAVNPEVVAVELTVYDLEEHAAGTMDYLFRIIEGEYMIAGAKALKLKGGLYVGDLKSGNWVDETAEMQTATYGIFWENLFRGTEGFEEVVGTLVIHTNASTKKGIEGLTTVHRNREEMIEDYDDFKSTHKIWKKKFGSSRPNIMEFPMELSL